MNNKRVFVVQQQLTIDTKGNLSAKFDLTPAEQFGEIVNLLGPTAGPFSSEDIIAELHTKLADYNDNDHLLLVGNPCLIGWAVAVAAQHNEGRVNLLQWQGREQKYFSIQSKI